MASRFLASPHARTHLHTRLDIAAHVHRHMFARARLRLHARMHLRRLGSDESGGQHLKRRQYALGDTPIFARAGAVVPMRRHQQHAGAVLHRACCGCIMPWCVRLRPSSSVVAGSPNPLMLYAVHGTTGSVLSYMYDDSGDGTEYSRDGAFRLTRINHTTTADGHLLQVYPRAAGTH